MRELWHIVCGGCGTQCRLAVTVEAGEVAQVEGAFCKQGWVYARHEVEVEK